MKLLALLRPNVRSVGVYKLTTLYDRKIDKPLQLVYLFATAVHHIYLHTTQTVLVVNLVYMGIRECDSQPQSVTTLTENASTN